MGLKLKIADWVVRRAIRLNEKKDGGETLSLPIENAAIKNVLVILPVSLNYVEDALNFFHRLKKTFGKWNFIVLDVAKIEPDKLNWLELPSAVFLEKLRKENVELAIDLNVTDDLKSIHLISALQPRYRLTVRETKYSGYNLVFSASDKSLSPYSHVIPALNAVVKSE